MSVGRDLYGTAFVHMFAGWVWYGSRTTSTISQRQTEDLNDLNDLYREDLTDLNDLYREDLNDLNDLYRHLSDVST